MRKYINIVGVGNRQAGVSQKTNRSYDFTPISFTYDDHFTTGLKAASTNVSADCLSGYVPAVGDTIEVVMHDDFRTGRIYIDAVL